MEESSFWKKFGERTYLSYFFIFLANIVCWQGSIQTLLIFVEIERIMIYLFFFTISTIVSSLITGIFIDYSFNRRKFIIIGFFLYICGFTLPLMHFLGFTSIERSSDVMLMSLILGVAFGISNIAIGAYFADISPSKERGKLQGISYCISFGVAFIIFLVTSSLVFIISLLSILSSRRHTCRMIWASNKRSSAASQS